MGHGRARVEAKGDEARLTHDQECERPFRIGLREAKGRGDYGCDRAQRGHDVGELLGELAAEKLQVGVDAELWRKEGDDEKQLRETTIAAARNVTPSRIVMGMSLSIRIEPIIIFSFQ